MEIIKSLDLNILLRNKLLLLLCLINLSIVLFADNLELITQPTYILNVNESNLIMVKIINHGKTAKKLTVELDIPESMQILSSTENLSLYPKSERMLQFSLYLSKNQFKQRLILPLIIRDTEKNEQTRAYINLYINPYTDFKVQVESESDYAIEGKDFNLLVNLENDSNVPCYGKIYNQEYNLNYTFKLAAGQSDKAVFKLKDLNNGNDVLPLIISADYKFIFEDSINYASSKFTKVITYYPLWKSDISHFYKVPSSLSFKSSRSYRDKEDWNYWISSYGYGEISKDNSLAWYLKKYNGQYLTTWDDNDDYWLNLTTKHSVTYLGKQSYRKSHLLGNQFGDGVKTDLFFNHLYLSLSQIKEEYRDNLNYSAISTGILFNQGEENEHSIDNSFILSYQKKYNQLGQSNGTTIDSLDNEKLSIQFALSKSNRLRFKSEYLFFKNTGDNNWFKNAGILYNELLLQNETSSFKLNTEFQNDLIKGELAENKTLESTIVHREKDNFLLQTGFRYQDIKSDYHWSYPYKQINQYYYVKARARLYSLLHAVVDINNSNFTSTKHDYNSKDKTDLYGMAFIYKQFYGEILTGKRSYNYFYKNEKEEIWKFNLRYFYLDKLYFTNDNQLKRKKEQMEIINYISAEFKPTLFTNCSLGIEHNHYNQDIWRDVIIYNTDFKYEFKKSNYLSFSAKFYNYLRTINQNNYSMSLEYSIPLQMPVYPKRKPTGLIVKVKDPFFEKPVTNALIKANNYYALTNDKGIAEFYNIPENQYHIEIKNMPDNYLSNIELPLTSQVHNKEIKNEEIQIINPGQIKVKVNIYIPEKVDLNKSYKADSLSMFNNELVSGTKTGISDKSYELRVYLEKDSLKYTKEINLNGEVEFLQLKPGNWKLRIDPRTIPECYEADLDDTEILVESNTKHRYEINLYPKLSRFESFQKGTIIIK